MNYIDTKRWIGVQGHTNLKTTASYNGTSMKCGQKFTKGLCSGMAGSSAGSREWDIVGFADPVVWMALSNDPNPENWAPQMQDAVSVVVKDKWGYEIYNARDVISWIK